MSVSSARKREQYKREGICPICRRNKLNGRPYSCEECRSKQLKDYHKSKLKWL